MALHKVGLIGGKIASLEITRKDGMGDVTPLVFAIVGRVTRFIAAVGKGALERLLLSVYSHMSSQCFAILSGKLAVGPVAFVWPNRIHVNVEPIRCC